MAWTKQELIEAAFEEVGLAAWTYELQPEQYQAAARRLDAMIADWQSRGVLLRFNLGGDVAEDSGLKDVHVSAVTLALAVRTASSFGKVPSNELKAAAGESFQALVIEFCQPRPHPPAAGQPLGAGHGGRFTPATDPSPFRVDAAGNWTANTGQP